MSFANNCLGQTAEVYLKNAVSRAYYAVFHSSSAALPIQYQPQRDNLGSSHKKLIQAYQKYGESGKPGFEEASEIAVELGMLKSARVRADYFIGATINKNYADSKIGSAEYLMNLIDQFTATISAGP